MAAPTCLTKRSALTKLAADITFFISCANRENENRIVLSQATALQPIAIGRFPPLIINAGGQLRDIIRGRVALNACELAKIVHRVRSVGHPAAGRIKNCRKVKGESTMP